MGKVVWIIVLIIVAVAIYNVFAHLSQSVKLGNLSSIFKLPSGLYQPNTKPTFGVSVNSGKPLAPPSVTVKPAQPLPPIVPPAGFTAGQLSPYYGQVRISSVSQGGYNYSPSQISLRADYSLQNPINVTGWSIRTNKAGAGSILFVPGAVADYDPSGLAPAGGIILGKGDVVNVYDNAGPLGAGLRLNECAGYLNASFNFNPALPNNCPAVYDRSEIFAFSGSCQSLILSLWSCAVPSADQINSVFGPNEGACRTMLFDRFNYRGCYRLHRGDANFFSNEWRVWLNSAISNIDWVHDRLVLLDKNGLVVDVYVY